MNQALMKKGVELILQGMIGPSWQKDPNFRETPSRVARMYIELLSPQKSHWATFPATSADMIVLRGHRLWALCPHHLAHVEMTAWVAYVPNELTVGISKLARVVDQQLVRPILQEDLVNDVADALNEKLRPKGVGVVIKGRHNCMTTRGAKSDGDIVVSAMRGVLLLNPAARQEFLSLLGDI
jgi:GTP cyclohydrolase I